METLKARIAKFAFGPSKSMEKSGFRQAVLVQPGGNVAVLRAGSPQAIPHIGPGGCLFEGDVEKAELAQKLERDLLLVQDKIQEIDTKTINADLTATLESIRSFSERTNLFLYNAQGDFSEIMGKFNTILSNLSEFSQKIRQNPSALIRTEKKSGR